MILRPATAEDAPQLAKLINMAMLEITYQFIGQENEEEANCFMESLIKERNNQYSYENIYILQELDNIVGHISIYNGADLFKLRKNVWSKIKEIYGHDYTADDETGAGEMYIDTFAISPTMQGKGLAKELLQFAIDHFVVNQKKTLGLLVDKENPKAKNLYLKMGFKVTEKRNIFGKEMEHMQYQPDI